MELARSNTADFIQVEDYDASTDQKFVTNSLVPYFKDLYKDLHLRCQKPSEGEKHIDKVTFVEYCQLPGIIGDRFFQIFNPSKEGITENQFVSFLTLIYVSEIDTKMRVTFRM